MLAAFYILIRSTSDRKISPAYYKFHQSLLCCSEKTHWNLSVKKKRQDKKELLDKHKQEMHKGYVVLMSYVIMAMHSISNYIMTELGQNTPYFHSHIHAMKWWRFTWPNADAADVSTLYSPIGQGSVSALKPVYDMTTGSSNTGRHVCVCMCIIHCGIKSAAVLHKARTIVIILW